MTAIDATVSPLQNCTSLRFTSNAPSKQREPPNCVRPSVFVTPPGAAITRAPQVCLLHLCRTLWWWCQFQLLLLRHTFLLDQHSLLAHSTRLGLLLAHRHQWRPDHYVVLGVARNATFVKIKRTYRSGWVVLRKHKLVSLCINIDFCHQRRRSIRSHHQDNVVVVSRLSVITRTPL